MKTPRNWYRFHNVASDPTVAEIYVIDIIGDWIDEIINEYWGMQATLTAKAFLEQLSNLDPAVKTILVHINSPGGDVFAAANIANALRDQQVSKGRTVETIIDGLAASAASVIAMAGSKVSMADNALMMIHQPWSMAVGNAAEMRKQADVLDACTRSIVATYKWHSTLNDAEITTLMDDETWMSADEAVTYGFATDTIEGLKAAASIDARAAISMNVPDRFKDRVAAFFKAVDVPPQQPQPASATAVLQACTAAGCLELAETLITENATVAQVTSRVDSERQKRTAAQTRATAITAVCLTAKVPELAAGYIAGAMTMDQVRAHVTVITARLDKIEIDGGLSPEHKQEQVANGWKKAHKRAHGGRK